MKYRPSEVQAQAFLSTLSLRRATHYDNYNLHCVEISIHALLAESDIVGTSQVFQRIAISIHALLAESDGFSRPLRAAKNQFLSTLSLRRATALVWCFFGGAFAFLSTLSLRRATSALTPKQNPTQHFYPRSPCGERPVLHDFRPLQEYFYPRSPCGERQAADISARRGASISIHALLAESDPGRIWSTAFADISIHALLAESDHPKMSDHPHNTNFYPRSPCGERPPRTLRHCTTYLFLSTLSLRRATEHLLII